jgi:hypothetical protein
MNTSRPVVAGPHDKTAADVFDEPRRREVALRHSWIRTPAPPLQRCRSDECHSASTVYLLSVTAHRRLWRCFSSLTWAVAIWRPFFTDRHGVNYKSKPSLWVPVTPRHLTPRSFSRLPILLTARSSIRSEPQLRNCQGGSVVARQKPRLPLPAGASAPFVLRWRSVVASRRPDMLASRTSGLSPPINMPHKADLV